MTTKKGFITSNEGELIILPITRGELVLDSKGNPAFESEDFVATDEHPGLITSEEKIKLSQAPIVREEEDNVIQLLIEKDGNQIEVFPKIDLDEYPILNSTKAVSSGGVWQHIDDTVGEIHRNITKI